MMDSEALSYEALTAFIEEGPTDQFARRITRRDVDAEVTV